MNAKGFIGSIGDDLPSLVPILFALLIFFSVFSFSLDAFNSRKLFFDRQLEITRIADGLRSNGFLLEYGQFRDLCLKLVVSRMNYFAGLSTRLLDPAGGSGTVDLFSEDFFIQDESDAELSCANVSRSDFEALRNRGRGNLFVQVYPVVVSVNGVVVPYHLVVVAWPRT
ncbi:MAG: hypothetical protein HY917_01665 [Candidatus Diapherotrites archaeon]|nr:hypothetical protein [Candidatus Diapherotrites archaeon]